MVKNNKNIMKLLKIRELKLDDENEDSGVQAISFVTFPANEQTWLFLAEPKKQVRNVSDITEDNIDLKYRWVLGSNEEVCPACVKWSNMRPKTLRRWVETAIPRTPIGTKILNLTTKKGTDLAVKKGWTGKPVDKTGDVYNTFCEDKCRCYLELVDININNSFDVEFSIEEQEEKREVFGCVLQSNKMIYRKDIGNGPGYVWFSRDTIRKIYQKYGYSKNVTFQHIQNKPNSVIMMKSWLQESDDDTSWFVKYKIIDNNLWEQIKKGIVRGFSLEGNFI